MSKHLAHHLGIEEHQTAALIGKFEGLSGFPCEDNRLLAEVKASLRHKMADLKLDPDDTTPKELYFGVLSRFAADAQRAGHLLGSDAATQSEALKLLINLTGMVDIPRDVWVLKRSAAKDLLRGQPPKKLMRLLKYRSVESMLKREDIDELYGALVYIESSSWRKAFCRSLNSLSPSDFETREISIVAMNPKRWRAINPSALSTSPLIGAVFLWPAAGRSLPHRLGSFLATLEAIESLRLSSLGLMAVQTRPDFTRLLMRQMEKGPSNPALVAAYPISWRTINHYYGHLPKALHPALSESYLQTVNFHKFSPSRVLAALHPAFRWWEGNDLLAAPGKNSPVSLKISDAAGNYAAQNSYLAKSSRSHQRTFFDELIARYMKHPGVESYILRQVEKRLAGPKATFHQSTYLPQLQAEFQLT